MHKEILTEEQVALLPLLRRFSKDFGLVGGTAIALHLGHRRSIDFDLFTADLLKNQAILRKISKIQKIDKIIVNQPGELTIIVKGAKLTYFNFHYKIDYVEKIDDYIKIPDLLTLAAMKAFALGMRAKWKDYVDLCFITRHYNGSKEICVKAKEIFGQEFNEKLFRIQLAYFADINYSEAIIFMPGFEVNDEKIKQELIEFSLN